MPVKKILISAIASGSGKTIVTLALLRLMKQQGKKVIGAKLGPDYIDPAFHALASGFPSVNFDPWAMSMSDLASRMEEGAEDKDLLLIEGAMGLFDGKESSSASLARQFNIPIVLILDVKGQAETALAVVLGMQSQDPALHIAGVILNRVGSTRHEKMIRDAWSDEAPPILGSIPASLEYVLPSRHLGLVQAQEHSNIDHFLEEAARALEGCLDIYSLCSIAQEGQSNPGRTQKCKSDAYFFPIQRLAIARDEAFSFLYPHHILEWRASGVEIHFFSPLSDGQPDPNAEAIFLPGGYPELYAGRLSGAENFHRAMKQAASEGKIIYGECGGYMALGSGLIDAKGKMHSMLGLLPLVSDFSATKTKRQLGYREVSFLEDTPLGRKGSKLRGHEFHYATIASGEEEEHLFQVMDRQGRCLGRMGRRQGRIMGSFFHMIDPVTGAL